jgi:hypothetical protein
LDEIIRQEETPDTPSPQLLRLDAAVPNKVQLNKAFDLAVTVRQTSSPVLSEDDLPVVKSGDVQVSWPKSQSYVRLRIQVSAPDCEIHGEDNRLFRLFWGQDSPMFYFHLTPKKQGVISIIVRVYQEHDWLGSARVHTIAYEQIVGSVQVEITSQKMESTTPSLTTLSITPSLIDLIESSGDFDSIEPQIMYLSRRLQKLREIQAVKGIDTEPHHLIEIDDLEAKLNELSKQRRDSVKGFHMDLSQ